MFPWNQPYNKLIPRQPEENFKLQVDFPILDFHGTAGHLKGKATPSGLKRTDKLATEIYKDGFIDIGVFIGDPQTGKETKKREKIRSFLNI